MARETHGATWRELKSEVAPIMRGASASLHGAAGMAPAPRAGQQGLFLRGDGEWAAPSVGGGGAVDSVEGSGGSTGLTLTGGPTGDVTLTLGGTLDIGHGGTGASTVGGAQATLDLEPGVDVQEYSANLAYLAGVTLAANIKSILEAADYAAVRTLLSLVVGTNVQAYDAELAALAALVSAADKLPYFTGSGTAALATLTAAARTLLDDTTVALMRDTLGETQAKNKFWMGPESGSDATPTFRLQKSVDLPAGIDYRKFDPYAPPASPDATRDFEANRALTGATGSIPSVFTEWDPGGTFTPDEDQFGFTMESTGTQTRAAGAYVSAISGDFEMLSYCGIQTGATITQTATVGIGVLQDVSAPTTSDWYMIGVKRNARQTEVEYLTANQYNPAGTTSQSGGNSVNGLFVRFQRITISGTATWIWSYGVDGENWVHVHSQTEVWTISRPGPIIYAGCNTVFRGHWRFVRFNTTPALYKPCYGQIAA